MAGMARSVSGAAGARAQVVEYLSRLQRLATTLPPARGELERFGRRSKIIATLGPKADEALVDGLICAGMNVARLNFSHGSHEQHARTIDMVRTVQRRLGRSDVAIALDTSGPEIRTGMFASGTPAGNPLQTLLVRAGSTVLFSADEALRMAGDERSVYVDYAGIGCALRPGSLMLVDDGLLEFEVIDTGSGWVRARARNDGELGERKGVNLPGTDTTMPAVSEKDARDIRFGRAHGVDFVFASFVRSGADIEALRAVLGPSSAKLIAKIENVQGVRAFDEILRAADGVMVARGDLGIELPAPKVFVAQKMIIDKCLLAGKPVICATQMLESMVANPRPTRAEVSDTANAVLDGADAVMLSGETAKGKWPLEAVRVMDEIAREAEAVSDEGTTAMRQLAIMPRPAPSIEAVAAAAARAAFDQQAAVLLVVTETGDAPRLVAKYRPGAVPIVAACASESIARQCALLRGVVPIVVPWGAPAAGLEIGGAAPSPPRPQDVIDAALAEIKRIGLVSSGSAVVLHDTDIGDGEEMSSWVLRIVELDGHDERSDYTGNGADYGAGGATTGPSARGAGPGSARSRRSSSSVEFDAAVEGVPA